MKVLRILKTICGLHFFILKFFTIPNNDGRNIKLNKWNIKDIVDIKSPCFYRLLCITEFFLQALWIDDVRQGYKVATGTPEPFYFLSWL